MGEKLPRTRGFEAHETNKTFVVLQLLQLSFGIVEACDIFLRQINSASLQVLSNITNNVCHLQGQAELNRIFFAARIAVSKNLNAHQTYRAGHPIAINAQLLKGGIPPDGYVHLNASNNLLQHTDR